MLLSEPSFSTIVFCIALFFFVQVSVLLLGLAFILVGLAAHYLKMRTLKPRSSSLFES